MTSPFRFRMLGGGAYDVIRREDNAYLGRAVKGRSRSSPLSLVDFWIAYDRLSRSIKDGGGQVAARFATRSQAAEALDRKV